MWHGGILNLRVCVAGAVLAAAVTLAAGSTARAQEVAALVNGVPITELDITQRQKLEQLSTQKLPPRQDVLNTLIDEILEIREAKNFSIEVPNAEVEASYANVAQHMGIDTDKLTAILAHAGSSAEALKHRLRAQMAWNALIRGRFKASLEIADTDVEAEMHLHQSDDKDATVGYEYELRPIVFVVESGSPDTLYESRKREADALRARFADCSSGIAFARALDEVAVRDQVIKYSADLPKPSRDILDGTELGHLTPPERTAEGFQMFAVCGKRQTKNDSPEQKKLHDEMFQKKFDAQASAYLRKLRREAMIEYK